MRKNNQKKYSTATTSEEIGEALGLSPSDIMLMEYKARLSSIASKAISSSGLSVNDIVKKSGVARSKVSAVKNGALAGISSDLIVKIIAATGTKLKLGLAS